MIPAPKACVFDAFGTLFNLSIPLERIDQLAEGKGQALLDIWRRKQLEYTWLRSLMKRYISFDQVTEEALQFAMNSLKVTNTKLFDILMPIYRQANAFADVRLMLEFLKARSIPSAILSNGTLDMLKAGIVHAGVDGQIDHLLSVDAVKVFKPDPLVYQMAIDSFGCTPADILFFSSNPWDISGAGTFGLQTVWVNRSDSPLEVLPSPPKYIVRGMEEAIHRMEENN